MPPTPSASSAAHSPRLVLYQQTHHTKDGEPISILPLVTKATGITHLYIAAIHLNDPPGHITLNDDPPHHPKFTQLWNEVKLLQGAGVKAMLMLGGAAQGSFARLSGPDASFEAYYKPLAQLLRARQMDGIDLDIEEPFQLAHLERLLYRLKSDFGSSFIITLAPVAPALIPLKPYLTSLCRKLLNPSSPTTHSVPEIVKAFLKPAILTSRTHLSSFNHFALESSPAGALVSWYNVQFYNGWGDASDTTLYDLLVGTGWKPHRIVLGVLTNPGNGGSGYVPLERLKSVVEGLRGRYGTQFGGIMAWEYFNAGLGEEEEGRRGLEEGPWEWVRRVGSVYLPSPSVRPPLTGSTAAGPSTIADIVAGLSSLQVPGNITSGDVAEPQRAASSPTEQAGGGGGDSGGFPEEHIRRLVELGFERAEAIAALEAMSGDVDGAAALLFGE